MHIAQARTAAGAMKLDVNVLRYLSREDFRVLVAVEMATGIAVAAAMATVAMVVTTRQSWQQ